MADEDSINEPLLTGAQLTLMTTPTGGASGEHSPYYRRLLSAGYKGFLQGTIGGALIYGLIGTALGCLIAGLFAGTWLSIAGLSLMTVGLYAGNAHLFPLPSVFLAGPALASGIAWVNSVGILGGSVSPPVMGWLKDYTGSFAGGLYALAGFAAMAAIVAAICVRETPVGVPAGTPATAGAGN